ncbi:MAG: hypothetical protein LBE12_08085 [Planctomycetaceae bacterium]|jgi:hypothetical protein|nr:hypothetical protein [Planctomycetaceae bacterium]
MKRFLSLILVLVLSGTVMAQPPFGKPSGGPGGNKPPSGLGGNKPPSGLGGFKPPSGLGGNKPPSGLGGFKPSPEAQIAGAIVGSLGRVIDDAARRERERREWERRYNQPPYRPPVYVQQPTRTVIVQSPTTVTSASVQTENASVTETPLTLTKNSITVTAKPATKDVVNKAKNVLNKEITEKLESFIDSLKDSVMSEEKANIIAQKFLDEGKDKKKIADFLNAVNNGDAETAGKLVSELADDPFEGNKIAQTINLGTQLAELEDTIQNGEFEPSDISDLKKLIDKAKLPAKVKKDAQKTLGIFKNTLKILDILTEFRESSKTIIPVPTDIVTVIYCPSLPAESVYAIDSETYLMKGEEFRIAEEDISDAFPQIPVYSNPVLQSAQTTNQISLVNTTNQTATYRLDDKVSRTLTSGKKASFSVPKSGTISIISQGYWKSFSVGSGNYSLDYSSKAWSIVVNPIKVTISNNSPLPFHCFADRTEYTINSGEQISFTSNNGILDLQFARSEDTGNRAAYQLKDSASYKIGLDQRDNKWALFPE